MLSFILHRALQGDASRAFAALASMSASTVTALGENAGVILAADEGLTPGERVKLRILMHSYTCSVLETSGCMHRALSPAEVRKLRAIWPPKPKLQGQEPLRVFLTEYRMAIRYGGPMISGSLVSMLPKEMPAKQVTKAKRLFYDHGPLVAVANVVPASATRTLLRNIDNALTDVLNDKTLWTA